MQKIIVPIRLPLSRNLDVEMPKGGVVRAVCLSLEMAQGIVASLKDAGKPAVREVMNLVVECTAEQDEKGETKDPDIEKRHFVVCPSMVLVDEAGLTYIGTAPSGNGNLLHVFEIIPADERKAGSFCSKCGHSVKTWYAADEGPCKCPYPYPSTS